MKVAILGGGISGLAAAWHLRDRAEAVVHEASDRAGGNLRTTELHGCLVEHGPQGFLEGSESLDRLVRELGIESRVVAARTSRRFLWRGGKLRERGGFLPFAAWLRLLCEPFAGRAPEGDESVFDFARRRAGRRAAELLADAFVGGVFAGDARRLSARSAFPRLVALEREHGSLLRARGSFRPRKLLSFDGGMEVLARALAERVDVRLNTPAARVERGDADFVLCTIHAARAAPLLPEPLPALVARIPAAPLAVVATVHEGLADVPDAFGFLAPRSEGLRVLGTLYESSIFPGRAPEGLRLFRTMIGGRCDPGAVDMDDGALLEAVARDLRRAWGVWQEPRAFRIVRHRPGIPQYELGHADLLVRIEAACPPWLRLAGWSYRGVSVPLCVDEALHWSP